MKSNIKYFSNDNGLCCCMKYSKLNEYEILEVDAKMHAQLLYHSQLCLNIKWCTVLNSLLLPNNN